MVTKLVKMPINAENKDYFAVVRSRRHLPRRPNQAGKEDPHAGSISKIGSSTLKTFCQTINRKRSKTRNFTEKILSQPTLKNSANWIKKLSKAFNNISREEKMIVTSTKDLAEVLLPKPMASTPAISGNQYRRRDADKSKHW